MPEIEREAILAQRQEERQRIQDKHNLDQMLAAHNARRRARGEREMTVHDLELRVLDDLGEQRRRREALAAERELDELLEATNARRRARGLPERTREQAREEFGRGSGGGG